MVKGNSRKMRSNKRSFNKRVNKKRSNKRIRRKSINKKKTMRGGAKPIGDKINDLKTEQPQFVQIADILSNMLSRINKNQATLEEVYGRVEVLEK